MTVKINEIVREFKKLADLHPNIHTFGAGEIDDIQQDMKYYPYMWLVTDNSHTLEYTEDNGYRSVEFTFSLRIGDKRNNQTGYEGILGIGEDNQLDIISNTFQYQLDVFNTIRGQADVLPEVELVGDISIEPFYNEDDGDVCGNIATFTLRVKNDEVCITQYNI